MLGCAERGSAMTQPEFDNLRSSIKALSLDQKRQLRQELDGEIAAAASPSAEPSQGSLGAMRDAAEELDRIVEQAMRNRRERPWRLTDGE